MRDVKNQHVCTIEMNSSDCEFEEFALETVQTTQNNLLQFNELDFSNISDVDISDLDDNSSDFKLEIDGDPVAEIENAGCFTWRKHLKNVNIEHFTDSPGPGIQLDNTAKEINFFNLIFHKELYEKKKNK